MERLYIVRGISGLMFVYIYMIFFFVSCSFWMLKFLIICFRMILGIETWANFIRDLTRVLVCCCVMMYFII